MTQEQAVPRKSSRLKRWGFRFGIFILIMLGLGLISPEIPFGFLVLFMYLVSGIVPVIGLCLGGWILFLNRVVRQMQFDPAGIALGLSAFALLIFGVQYAVRRFAPHYKWSIMQTTRCVFLGSGLFTAGVCLICTGHEISWMTRSKTPWMLTIDTWWDSSYRRAAEGNLKQIARAVDSYSSEIRALPTGGSFRHDGTAGHGWMALLLPYFNRQSLYDQIDFGVPWHDPINRKVFETPIPEYQSKRHRRAAIRPDGYAPTFYSANDRLLNVNRGLQLREITDGSTNTIFAGEVKAKHRPWGDAVNWRDVDLGINQSLDGFGSDNQRIEDLFPFEIPSNEEMRTKIKKGAYFLMADGTVRFINENIDPQILHALATPDEGINAEYFEGR